MVKLPSRWLKSGYNMKRQVINVNSSFTDDGLFRISVDENTLVTLLIF